MPKPIRPEDPRVQAAQTAVRATERALDTYEVRNPSVQAFDGEGGAAYEKVYLEAARARVALRATRRELADEQEQAHQDAVTARQNRNIGFRN